MTPARVRETTSPGRRVIVEVTAPTRDALEAELVRYKAEYHPGGYATTFSTPQQAEDGSWRAAGSRLVSSS